MRLADSKTAERFWSKVDRGADEECWPWLGALRNGYGQVTITRDDGRRTRYAHRVSYEMAHGAIPDGMTIDHLCRTLRCVNPAHMEVVTRGENVLRGVGPSARNAAKTECQRGHPFNKENTYYRSTGNRYCRECARLLTEQAGLIRQRQELILHGHPHGLVAEKEAMRVTGLRLAEVRRLLAEETSPNKEMEASSAPSQRQRPPSL